MFQATAKRPCLNPTRWGASMPRSISFFVRHNMICPRKHSVGLLGIRNFSVVFFRTWNAITYGFMARFRIYIYLYIYKHVTKCINSVSTSFWGLFSFFWILLCIVCRACRTMRLERVPRSSWKIWAQSLGRGSRQFEWVVVIAFFFGEEMGKLLRTAGLSLRF